MEMKNYDAKQFIHLIDDKFQEFVGKIPRIDIQWGIWSREMNLVLNEKIKEGGSGAFVFGQVFSYWIIVSQLIDLMYDCKGVRRIIREKKIKKKMVEALVVRKRVMEWNENT
jgi:hypothetical protein